MLSRAKNRTVEDTNKKARIDGDADEYVIAEKRKKSQLSLTNSRDVKACQNCSSPIRRAYNVVADSTGLSSFV